MVFLGLQLNNILGVLFAEGLNEHFFYCSVTYSVITFSCLLISSAT